MRSGLTFIGLLVAAIGWMGVMLGLFLGGLLDAMPAFPGAETPSPPRTDAPIVAFAAGTLFAGLLLTGSGLLLGTRERPTKRKRPRGVKPFAAFRPKRILHAEPLEDGRTKYFYEGGETEIY